MHVTVDFGIYLKCILSKKYLKPKIQKESNTYIWTYQGEWRKNLCTLDSGINVASGITIASPLKKNHITSLILFYINLGIDCGHFKFFLTKIFPKINKRSPMFILKSRVGNQALGNMYCSIRFLPSLQGVNVLLWLFLPILPCPHLDAHK